MQVSVVICARDEAGRLDACLASLCSQFDEVVVVADRCTDATSDIARCRGAVVVEGIFPRERDRKLAGIAASRGDWILELDADEHIGENLANEVRAAVARSADWFDIPIDNYVGQRLVRWGWGGSFGTTLASRLYRRDAKAWKPDRVHPGVVLRGTYGGALAAPLRHYVDDDIGDMIERLNRYTALRGADLADRDHLGGLWENVFRGVRRFWKCYIRRKGSREGEIGFLLALMAALYPILSYLRAKEIKEQRSADRDAGPAATTLRMMR